MNYKTFEELAINYNFIPVYEKITADFSTPVSAYLKLRNSGMQCFLLESVEGKESLGRYSFIGINPEKTFSNIGMDLTIIENGNSINKKMNILDFIKEEINSRKHPQLPELPHFTGGMVGYLGYENMALIENVLSFDKNGTDNADSIFGVYNTLIAFDHFKHQIILITNVNIKKDTNLQAAYEEAKQTIKNLKKDLSVHSPFKSDFKFFKEIKESISDENFHKLVEAGKRNILEGDIFQIVLSKRFSTSFSGDLFNVYRALRIINPSPYMYYLQFENEFTILGTSPENLVKVRNGVAEVLPIAGTRKRGNSPEEDMRLEENMINDPKERAEHVMLLDLGRNDLGRVCQYDSVKVIEEMKVHRYSHVMHMVSKVHGRLSDDKDCIDVLKACFPAGTVTGAPKIRAMQLIKEYEKLNRNVYAGAIGYIDYSGNLDMCIAIRTLFSKNDIINWQAGAGIVADSIPRLESKEIKNKSAALINALQHAEVIDEDISD